MFAKRFGSGKTCELSKPLGRFYVVPPPNAFLPLNYQTDYGVDYCCECACSDNKT